jgi:hypothetical protein
LKNANCRTLLALVATTLPENWVYDRAGEFTSDIMVVPAKLHEKSFGVPSSSASQKETW